MDSGDLSHCSSILQCGRTLFENSFRPRVVANACNLSSGREKKVKVSEIKQAWSAWLRACLVRQGETEAVSVVREKETERKEGKGKDIQSFFKMKLYLFLFYVFG